MRGARSWRLADLEALCRGCLLLEQMQTWTFRGRRARQTCPVPEPTSASMVDRCIEGSPSPAALAKLDRGLFSRDRPGLVGLTARAFSPALHRASVGLCSGRFDDGQPLGH